MNALPDVSVVVPVRNGGEYVRRLVDALERQTLARNRFEVVIGDDGSTDGATNGIETPDGWLRVIRGAPCNSYAARNRAVAAARSEVIAFCDVDCRPDRVWLEAGLAALAHADIVAGLVRFDLPANPSIWAILDAGKFLDQEGAVSRRRAFTANLFVRRPVFEATGGFDDSLASGSDAVFVLRSTQAGATLQLSADAVVTHPPLSSRRDYLGKLRRVQHASARRKARTGLRPRALTIRFWIPFVGELRERRRTRRPLLLDSQRLAQSGYRPSWLDEAKAFALSYVALPYYCGPVQISGWRLGRREVKGSVPVLLVCSTGGHLLQLVALREAWEGLPRAWVTFDKSDARSLLAGERVFYAHGPTNRSVTNLARNLVLAIRIVGRLRPEVVLTTGAGVAVPFAWIARVRGARVVYVESLTRIESVSLSCKLIKPVADRVYVQWPELQRKLPGSRYSGAVVFDR